MTAYLIVSVAFLNVYSRSYTFEVLGGALTFFSLVLFVKLLFTCRHEKSRISYDLKRATEHEVWIAFRSLVQCSLAHLRTLFSVFLSFSVPRLRQFFVFWQNIADKTLFESQVYSQTTCVS